jgi:hypothetical protein
MPRPQPFHLGAVCDVGAFELSQDVNLAVTASSGPEPVAQGSEVTLTFTVASGAPPDDFADIARFFDGTQPVVTATLPAGLEFVSGSGCSAAGAAVTCTMGTLLDKHSGSGTVVAKATGQGTLTTRASVTSPRPDPNATDDSASVVTTISVPAGPGGNTRPGLAALGMKPSRFRPLASGASIARRVQRGTTVSYTLSEPARTRFTVQRKLRGHRRGKKCVTPRRAPRGRNCTRWKTVKGAFTHLGKAGVNSFRFTGRLRRRALRPGSYRLVAVASDAGGLKSGKRRVRFTIIR